MKMRATSMQQQAPGSVRNSCFLNKNWGMETRTASRVAMAANTSLISFQENNELDQMQFYSSIHIIILIGKLSLVDLSRDVVDLLSSPATIAERKARKTFVENLMTIFLLLICMAQWRPAKRTNSAELPTCTREHTPAIFRYTETVSTSFSIHLKENKSIKLKILQYSIVLKLQKDLKLFFHFCVHAFLQEERLFLLTFYLISHIEAAQLSVTDALINALVPRPKEPTVLVDTNPVLTKAAGTASLK